jgi:alkylhydroperoxidase/carboxymuconolactone decarboxylase family protein YurZ
MESYLGVAKEEGITDEEIGAVLSVVMAVSAGRVQANSRTRVPSRIGF